MNVKVAVGGSSASPRLLKHRKHTVLHNGSFITEAFPVKIQNTYDDIERESMDSCLSYQVYHDANTVAPTDNDTSHSLTPVDHFFALASDDGKISQEEAAISKDVYNQQNPEIEAGPIQMTEVASALTTDDGCYASTSLGGNVINLHSQPTLDAKKAEILSSASTINVFPKISDETSTNSALCILSSSNGFWDKDSTTLANQDAEGCSTAVSSVINGTHMSYEHSTPVESTSVLADNVKIVNDPTQMSFVATDLELASNIHAAHQPNEQLHIINAVAAEDGTIELMDANGRMYRIQASEESAHSSQRSVGESLAVQERPYAESTMQLVDHEQATVQVLEHSPDQQTVLLEHQPTVELLESAHQQTNIQLIDSTHDAAPVSMLDDTDSTSVQLLQTQHEAAPTQALDQPHEQMDVQLVEPVTLASGGVSKLVDGENQKQQLTPSEGLSTSMESKTSSPSKPSMKACKGLVPVTRRPGGWPKGKRRSNDRFRIKAPKTAYLLFAKKRRKELMAENPNYTFAEVTVIMGKDWTTLDSSLKKEYIQLAEQDQARFTNELTEYQQTDEYKTLLKRKRDETSAKLGGAMEEDLGYVEEEYTLFCHICNQRFSSRHNRKEHLAGRMHLKNLEAELRKQQQQPTAEQGRSAKDGEQNVKGRERKCCKHCVNRVQGTSTGDASLDIIGHMESFISKHSERELELQVLRESAVQLKEVNSQLSKEMITVQETIVKLRQEIQSNKQWQMQLAASIDNLKMVPTLFGVINF